MLERIDAEHMGQLYTHEIRTGLFSHMNQISPRLLQSRSRGGIMLRFIGDLNALKQWVSLGVARLTVASITTIITLVILSFINASLALAVSCALVLGGLGSYALGGWLQNAVREARRRRARLAANVSEKIASPAVVQAFGQSRRERRRVKRQSEELMNAMISRAQAIGAFRGVIELTAALATGSALLVGAILVNNGDTTPGTVVAAMSIVGLLIPSLRDLGRVQEYWHGAVVSREKISDFIAMPRLGRAPKQAKELPQGQGELRFENVRITQERSPKNKGFNAQIPAGQVVALVGPNGAGKSTLLALTARLMDLEQGKILLDGHDITKVEPNSLNEAVGVMTPDLPLLRGSIERNLSYRLPKATKQELAEARRLCDIDELIESLPKGIRTRVTEEGGNLSLGQRQRIGLARAILGNPRLLLLDEVDANLDHRAASALRRVLADYSGTVLLVTHRLDWVKLADQVWYIDNGQLVETGKPDDLLNRNSSTARLFQRHKVVNIQAAS
jgi:ABC-type multidrug transport system fused ATPase/permease subunit